MGQQHGADGITPQFKFAVLPGVGDAFEMWRWAVSPMFDVSAARRQDTKTFAMDTTGYHFAEMAVSRTRSSATVFQRSNAVLARSGSDGILVQVYLKGGYVLEAGGRRSTVEAGDIALIVLTQRSAILAEDYLNISLVLPQRILAPMLEPIDDLHGLVLRNGTPLNAFLKSHLKTLHAQAGRIGLAAGPGIVESTCALVAACMGSTARAREAGAAALRIATLTAIRQTIEAELADPGLSPDTLAERFEISRATLYRMFEPLGGVRAYINDRRLQRAYGMIADPAAPNAPIGAIARRCGFSTAAAFNRAFRDRHQATPTDVRAAAQAGRRDPDRSSLAGSSSFNVLNRWLLGLADP